MNKVQDSCTGPRFPWILHLVHRDSWQSSKKSLDSRESWACTWILHFVHRDSSESWACAGFVPFSHFKINICTSKSLRTETLTLPKYNCRSCSQFLPSRKWHVTSRLRNLKPHLRNGIRSNLSPVDGSNPGPFGMNENSLTCPKEQYSEASK